MSEKEIDVRPRPTRDERWARPPLSEVPMWAAQAVWKWAVPGGWEERVAKIVTIECRACSLWYRAYEDDPRPCPCCTERDARQADRKEATRHFEGGRLREKALLAELTAARRVVEASRPRRATLAGGFDPVEHLVALGDYDAVAKGRCP